MKKTILLTTLIILITSCVDNKKNDSKELNNTTEKKVVKVNTLKTQNYAVVFNWSTDDEKLVEDNAMQQADQLLDMWKNNIVENVYYNSNPKVDKLSYFPNITFVIKAENIEEAEILLNNLVVVKKGIAYYKTFPIGNLWLKRNTKVIQEKGITNSYISVWSTKSKPDDAITKAQNDAIMSLWKKGTIENVYFDIEGAHIQNNKTDFVFSINANSKEEAENILKDLPFVKKDIASYKLHQVGVFWMGVNNN